MFYLALALSLTTQLGFYSPVNVYLSMIIYLYTGYAGNKQIKIFLYSTQSSPFASCCFWCKQKSTRKLKYIRTKK